MKKTAILKFAIPGLLLAALLWSCYPGGPENIAELDLVFTAYDQGADFKAIRTYAMPDEVFEREGSDETSDQFDSEILAEIANQMQRLGYIRELDPVNNGVDVLIVCSKSKTTTIWGGWVPGYPPYPGWGWWGPGWGWGSPWYPVGGSFTTGTVFIDMADPNDRDEGAETIPTLWAAALNGLVSSSSGATQTRITSAIAQAFDQSPYLGR